MFSVQSILPINTSSSTRVSYFHGELSMVHPVMPKNLSSPDFKRSRSTGYPGWE